MSKTADDTDKIQTGVCLAHSGVCANVKNLQGEIMDVWKAVGQMRVMFATTMLSALGTMALIIWSIVSNKIGL